MSRIVIFDLIRFVFGEGSTGPPKGVVLVDPSSFGVLQFVLVALVEVYRSEIVWKRNWAWLKSIAQKILKVKLTLVEVYRLGIFLKAEWAWLKVYRSGNFESLTEPGRRSIAQEFLKANEPV